ncbi:MULTISPECIES: endo alpha-1,4 polygalactosaminidase [Flavobacterium]|uniref:endo alpha-1,4 polygalactosaminidase n=1 Tax=Flavobacterium TaxID=237 RepID=UPI001FCB144C|nr:MULTISPECIES: endo alpha-1,4 polygalactosaminidase [Flavobacterium]UOK41738.1 endo alpha-1,4 polygalactosaminidase [Flavobacterium enshiense]
MQRIKLFFCLLPSLIGFKVWSNADQQPNVFFCYGKLNPTEIKGYDYVVLESRNFNASDIKKVKSLNGKVLAYISLGEVNSQTKHYKKLKNITLGKNEIWDSYYLDLKSDSTNQVLFSEIDRMLFDGYDGLFLDNIDNFTTFGPQKDQKAEIIAFMGNLKRKYPQHYILQNAGIELLEDTHNFIDGIVVESVASNYSFPDKNYKLREKNEYDEYIKKLNLIRRKYKLPIILVEYADTQLLYNDIQKRISKTNFLYFIGTIDLLGVPNFTN